MTREPSVPPSQLQISKPATAREIVTELERLSIHFPRTDMDSRKWQALFETFVEDLGTLPIVQIRQGCQRYRKNAANRFFPTPGQLIEACQNPFETSPGRRYDPMPTPLPEIGQCVTPERMRADMARLGLSEKASGEKSLAMLKEEILARPKQPYVETPADVKQARAEALQRRLAQAGDFYAGTTARNREIA